MGTFGNIWAKIGGRKLVAHVLGLVAIMTLAFFGVLTEAAVLGILGLSAAFAGGNIAEHVSAAVKARALAGKPAPADPPAADAPSTPREPAP